MGKAKLTVRTLICFISRTVGPRIDIALDRRQASSYKQKVTSNKLQAEVASFKLDAIDIMGIYIIYKMCWQAGWSQQKQVAVVSTKQKGKINEYS